MVKRLSIAILLFPLASLAQVDIYRCQIDEVIIFADAPCQPDAVVYQPATSISVIETPSNLDEIRAANQALIQHRRARQAERAAATRAHAPLARPQHPLPREGVPVAPVYGLPFHVDRRAHHRPQRDPEVVVQRKQRFSALSGRLPGTRHREPDQ